MRTLLAHRDLGRETSTRRPVLERLIRELRARFGDVAVQVDVEEGPYDSVVAVLWPGDLDRTSLSLARAVEAAREAERPLIVVRVGDPVFPDPGRIDLRLRPLADAPHVPLDQLVGVLEHLDAPESPALPVRSRSGPRWPVPAPRARRARRPSFMSRFLARRDPVLLRIAGSSTLIGLVLLATLGLGASSLFLFLGAVSFLISKQSG